MDIVNLDYHFRHLTALRFDRDAMREHLLALGPHERSLRFAGLVSDDYLKRYIARFNWRDNTAIGYFDGGILRAMGECCMSGSGEAREAEFALSVEAGYQGRGIGTRLFVHMLSIARNRGAAAITLYTLPHNHAMKRIARKQGMALSWGAQVYGHLDVAPGNLQTLFDEWGAEQAAWAALLMSGYPYRRRNGGTQPALRQSAAHPSFVG